MLHGQHELLEAKKKMASSEYVTEKGAYMGEAKMSDHDVINDGVARVCHATRAAYLLSDRGISNEVRLDSVPGLQRFVSLESLAKTMRRHSLVVRLARNNGSAFSCLFRESEGPLQTAFRAC